ncbi:MAG TPA: lamin tail domain-containing protein [Candidatus Saccharibacteria bacterium]|nr:lamin tail domain-containing protein [Candidatus Saccharibacteria bacterium]
MFIFSPQPASAISTVVINEVHYNPSTGNQNDEFLELYNPSLNSIDIGNWSFSQGITLTFPAATTIPGHGYLVVSPSISQTLLTYGVTSIAQYAPSNLSNSGETVTLIDQNGTTIDSISYSDKAPWPTSPDGSGPSLELKSPALDNSLAASWGGSLTNGGTPGSVNSTAGSGGPSISNVTEPHSISSGQDVTISAQVVGALAEHATLTYKLNFDAEITVNMNDNGVNGDQTNGDGIYSATIPGVSERTLVRYKVSADNGLNTSSVPSSDDSRNYLGYYIKPNGLTSTVPVLDYFMDDLSYTLMVDGLSTTQYYPAVLIYDDTVWDSSQIRLKGNNTLYHSKKSFKLKLPSGYQVDFSGIGNPVDEFHLNGNQYSADAARVPLVWWSAKESGLTHPETELYRVQKNGEFQGSYLIVDKYEKQWRADKGLDEGLIYEDFSNYISGTQDDLDKNEWRNVLEANNRNSPSRLNTVYDRNNIPALINLMAWSAIVQHFDTSADRNVIYYRESTTQRWELLPWDSDGDFKVYSPKTTINGYDTLYPEGHSNFFFNAIYDDTGLRQAYYRRLRTLVDKFYTNGEMISKYTELHNQYADLSSEDNSKWAEPWRHTYDDNIKFMNWISILMQEHYSTPWGIPTSQSPTDESQIRFEQVSASLVPGDEFIKIHNNSENAVDISSWSISQINFTFPSGAVIPPGGSAFIVRSDNDFRALNPPAYVLGQFSDNLNNSGSLELKSNLGTIIDSASY